MIPYFQFQQNTRYTARVIQYTQNSLVIHCNGLRHELHCPDICPAKEFDLIQFSVTYKNNTPTIKDITIVHASDIAAHEREQFLSLIDPARITAAHLFAKITALMHRWFLREDFLEVRTPLLSKSPNLEFGLRNFKVYAGNNEQFFLPTSPEYSMKRLLTAGHPRIFQLAPVFRDAEPKSNSHLHEFTMLEWYRAYTDYITIMNDCQSLLYTLVKELSEDASPNIIYNSQTIDFTPPWRTVTVHELYVSVMGVNLATITAAAFRAALHALDIAINENADWDECFFLSWVQCIEPALGFNPVFVKDFPVRYAALAATASNDIWEYAQRFELYIGGLELANAFTELTDPVLQKERFIQEQQRRNDSSPLPAELLQTLRWGMPPSAGIALGIERLMMLLGGFQDIHRTSILP